MAPHGVWEGGSDPAHGHSHGHGHSHSGAAHGHSHGEGSGAGEGPCLWRWRYYLARLALRVAAVVTVALLVRFFPGAASAAGSAVLGSINSLPGGWSAVAFCAAATAFCAVSPMGYLPAVAAGIAFAPEAAIPVTYVSVSLGALLNAALVRGACLGRLPPALRARYEARGEALLGTGSLGLALEAHPIGMVALLRMPFLANGALNYILSLKSSLPLWKMLLGNAIGFLPGSVIFPIAGAQVRSLGVLIANGAGDGAERDTTLGVFFGIAAAVLLASLATYTISKRLLKRLAADKVAAAAAAAAGDPDGDSAHKPLAVRGGLLQLTAHLSAADGAYELDLFVQTAARKPLAVRATSVAGLVRGDGGSGPPRPVVFEPAPADERPAGEAAGGGCSQFVAKAPFLTPAAPVAVSVRIALEEGGEADDAEWVGFVPQYSRFFLSRRTSEFHKPLRRYAHVASAAAPPAAAPPTAAPPVAAPPAAAPPAAAPPTAAAFSAAAFSAAAFSAATFSAWLCRRPLARTSSRSEKRSTSAAACGRVSSVKRKSSSATSTTRARRSPAFMRPVSFSNCVHAMGTLLWFGMQIMRIQRPSSRSVLTALNDWLPPLTCATASVRPCVGRTLPRLSGIQSSCVLKRPVMAPCCSGETQTWPSLQAESARSSTTFGCDSERSVSCGGRPRGSKTRTSPPSDSSTRANSKASSRE